MLANVVTNWTDREIARFQGRVALFMRRGLAAEEAERIADELVGRDRDRDPRRHCVECSNLQTPPGRDRRCFAAAQGWMKGVDRRLQPVRNLLARCEFFSWQKP